MFDGTKVSGAFVMKSFSNGKVDDASAENEEAFGLPHSRPNRQSSRRNPFLPHRNPGGGAKKRGLDHEYQYPPDEYGGEMGPNARVWRVYLDEADHYDNETIEGFRDTTDVLLVFAGLFSAVVTTFVAQSSQALQPNYAQISASLMTELVFMQRALANGTPLSSIKPSELTFSSETTNAFDRWVNGLWFTSLTLSLIAALIAVLVKEWLQYYHSALSGTARERVLVRHFRFMGLDKWKVPAIIGILPVILHISLFMFLAGLVVYVWEQNRAIAYTILAMSGVSYVLYSASTILGGLRPDCSYKSPISYVISYLRQVILWIPHLRIRLSYLRRRRWPFINPAKARSPKELEREDSEQQMDQVLLEALRWLHTASSNPTNKRMVYLALAGIPFNLSQVNLIVDQHLTSGIQQEFEASVTRDQQTGLSDDTEVLIRSLALNHPVVSNNLLKQLQTAVNSQNSPVQALVACSLVHSLEHRLINVTTIFLIDLISSQARLPPTVWKSLFQRHLTGSEASESFRLVIMLLNMLSKATFETENESKANWLLPSSVGLAELCESEPRMSFVVLTFICWHLIDGSNADTARELLDAAENKFDGHAILVHVVLSILDRLHADLKSLRNEGSVAESLVSVENALFSLPTRLWCKPAFVQAMHRLGELGSMLVWMGRPSSSRLRFNARAPKSLAPLMSYTLDILQHPWPLAQEPGFEDFGAASEVLAALFDARDVHVYNALLDGDGLAVFQRCFPIDLVESTRSSKVTWQFMMTLRDALTCYIDSLSNPRIVDERTRQQHLDYIFQPLNLAWLTWISRYYNPHQRLLQDLFDLLRALRPDSRSWAAAAKILVDEMHRDAAAYGLGHRLWSDHYFGLRNVLKQLNLEEEYTLYGYVSKVENNPDFSRVETDSTTLSEPMYRPYVVRFVPRHSRLRQDNVMTTNRYYRVET